MQETWLKPPYKKHLGVNELRSFCDGFHGYGISAMENLTKIQRGRPYGGTGYLYPKKLVYLSNL
jgi:hypothetical protein